MERQLIDLVGDLLGYPADPAESFLSHGGNSLQANRVSARLKHAFGAPLPVVMLLSDLPLADVARAYERLRAGARLEATLEAGPTRGPWSGVAPLSYQQEQVWFHTLLEPDSRAYNFACTIRFRGQIRPDALEQAVRDVVRRHEILRSTYAYVASGPCQQVHDEVPVRLPAVDLRALEPAARKRALERTVDTEASYPFALDRLPLIRWTLARLADDDHVLIQSEHHMVHDGWSFGLLWQEIEAAYLSLTGDAEAYPAEPPIQYADYCRWQRAWFQGAVRERLLEYWISELRNPPPPLILRSARPRPAQQTFAGRTWRLDIAPETYAALRSLSRGVEVSLFTVMFAAFVACLADEARTEEMIVGTAVANREHAATERLIGMLVNVLPLRVRVDPGATFRQSLAAVQRTVTGGLDHQAAPFSEIVRAVDPPRDNSRNPLVQVCFSFHDAVVPEFVWPEVRGEFQVVSTRSAKFDLNVIAIPESEQRLVSGAPRPTDHLYLLWEYNTALFADADIVRLARGYATFLDAAVRQPDLPVADLVSGACE